MWSIAQYGCETSTIVKSHTRTLEAFERLCRRKKLAIKCALEITRKEEGCGELYEDEMDWCETG